MRTTKGLCDTRRNNKLIIVKETGCMQVTNPGTAWLKAIDCGVAKITIKKERGVERRMA